MRFLFLLTLICLLRLNSAAQIYSDESDNFIEFISTSEIHFCFNYSSCLGPIKFCGCSNYRIKGRTLILWNKSKTISEQCYNKFTKSKYSVSDIEKNPYTIIQVRSENNELIRYARVYYYDINTNEPIFFDVDWDGSCNLKLTSFPRDSILIVDCFGYQPVAVKLKWINSQKFEFILEPGNLLIHYSERLKLLYRKRNNYIECRFVGGKETYILKKKE